MGADLVVACGGDVDVTLTYGAEAEALRQATLADLAAGDVETAFNLLMSLAEWDIDHMSSRKRAVGLLGLPAKGAAATDYGHVHMGRWIAEQVTSRYNIDVARFVKNAVDALLMVQRDYESRSLRYPPHGMPLHIESTLRWKDGVPTPFVTTHLHLDGEGPSFDGTNPLPGTAILSCQGMALGDVVRIGTILDDRMVLEAWGEEMRCGFVLESDPVSI